MFCNPFSEVKANELVELLNVDSTGRVLDIACGKGELLRRVTHELPLTLTLPSSVSCIMRANTLSTDRLTWLQRKSPHNEGATRHFNGAIACSVPGSERNYHLDRQGPSERMQGGRALHRVCGLPPSGLSDRKGNRTIERTEVAWSHRFL